MRINHGLIALDRRDGKPIVLILLAVFSTLLLFSTQRADSQELPKSNFRFGEALNPQEKRSLIGSWGHLEFYQILLEPADYLLSLSSDLRNWKEGTVWRFSALNSDGVRGILENAGINPKLCDVLLSGQYMSYNQESGLYEIRPPESAIISLNSENRRLLYPQILPHDEQNPYHSNYALPVGGLKMVSYLPTGIPQEQLNLIQHLSYKKGKTTRFSDISLVLGKAENEEERWRILKTISRERSLSVKLRITRESNLSNLTRYWGAGGKNRELLPILESVMRTSGIETLDLIHLLPPTPRKLLHTYPTPDGYGVAEDLPDCFWTAASFFSEDPPDRHLDTIEPVISNRYEKATKPLQLGDIIFMTDKESGKPLHACNYLAGNLVYTKNGKSLGRPWIISTLEDVVEEYLSVDEMSLGFMRLKPQYQQ